MNPSSAEDPDGSPSSQLSLWQKVSCPVWSPQVFVPATVRRFASCQRGVPWKAHPCVALTTSARAAQASLVATFRGTRKCWRGAICRSRFSQGFELQEGLKSWWHEADFFIFCISWTGGTQRTQVWDWRWSVRCFLFECRLRTAGSDRAVWGEAAM